MPKIEEKTATPPIRRKNTAKAASAKMLSENSVKIQDEPIREEVSQKVVAATQPSPTNIEYAPGTFITVRNGFNGKLVYVSKRTNEKYVWDEFGAEQDLDIQELKYAKSSSKVFFTNNWFMFDDPNVVTYLGLTRYYKDALKYDEFEDLFDKTPDEVRARISKLSSGQIDSLKARVHALVENGTIDSIKMIRTLEDALHICLLSE